jgi:hypothetical protein
VGAADSVSRNFLREIHYDTNSFHDVPQTLAIDLGAAFAFRDEKTNGADWLLYGCFLSIEAEKHARDGKSRKAPHCQIGDTHETIANTELITPLACVFKVVVGEGFEPS